MNLHVPRLSYLTPLEHFPSWRSLFIDVDERAYFPAHFISFWRMHSIIKSKVTSLALTMKESLIYQHKSRQTSSFDLQFMFNREKTKQEYMRNDYDAVMTRQAEQKTPKAQIPSVTTITSQFHDGGQQNEIVSNHSFVSSSLWRSGLVEQPYSVGEAC